jgi:WXG100 family type VII secretion target
MGNGPVIAVDYVAMEDAASALQSSSRTIEQLSSELKSQLAKIDWQGGDREAYLAQQAKWDAALADINDLLNQVGAAVTTARQGYGDVEQAGVQAWG